MRKVILIILFLTSLRSFPQEVKDVRKNLAILTSPEMWGRGYTKDGMHKAADFLVSAFTSYGLNPMDGKSYEQPFTYPVNTFPGKMEVTINGQQLTPGRDFIVAQASAAVRTANAALERKDSVTFISSASRTVVSLVDKLTWSVARQVNDYSEILVRKSSLASVPKQLTANIENIFVPDSGLQTFVLL